MSLSENVYYLKGEGGLMKGTLPREESPVSYAYLSLPTHAMCLFVARMSKLFGDFIVNDKI